MNVDYATRESVTVRQPSTANLMVDSADRDENIYYSPADFQIYKNQSIMNGFFTRIGTTEVTLEWCEPNILYQVNDTLTFEISGNSQVINAVVSLLEPPAQGQPRPFANMTVADVLDAICEQLTGESYVSGQPADFRVARNYQTGRMAIDCSGALFKCDSLNYTLAQQLDLSNPLGDNTYSRYVDIGCPDLRLYRYLDFVSASLTYNQALKDNSTADIEKDVLCRWYMAEDTQEQYDAYGFPILMGYVRFVRRRIFNPPKQIRWDPSQPIGNLNFQVYTDRAITINGTAQGQLWDVFDYEHTNWLMTLQLSEV